MMIVAARMNVILGSWIKELEVRLAGSSCCGSGATAVAFLPLQNGRPVYVCVCVKPARQPSPPTIVVSVVSVTTIGFIENYKYKR